MTDFTDVRQLFSHYCRGEISAEQLQALESALREDADLRNEFIEYMNVDSGLGQLAALSKGERAEIRSFEFDAELSRPAAGESLKPSALPDAFFKYYRTSWLVAVVAAILLLATVARFIGSPAKVATSVATLVSQVDSALLHDGKPLNGVDLGPGRYELSRGLVHVRFGAGVMVYVEAPADFVVQSDKEVMLRNGRLSASVPPEGIGFVVQTPEAEVIDFGTEFSVDVEPGASEVHVFDGLVRVHSGRAGGDDEAAGMDVKGSQAVRITDGAEKPVDIELARDRFIRNFDEPWLNYALLVNDLSPLAYYRMAIRDYGLVSEPPQYSGVVLTGEGRRPPHAQGVFTGGSLRVGVDSSGRGGRVDSPPPLTTAQFSLTAFVYRESPAQNSLVATNFSAERGNFAVSLNENGLLQATIRTKDGGETSITGGSSVPQEFWRHIVVTADGQQLKIYEDGKLVASAPCTEIVTSDSDTIWFGTDENSNRVWDGRIDEMVLFDRALTEAEVAALYRTAQEEIDSLK